MEPAATTIFVFLATAVVFVGGALWAGRFVRPRVKERGRNETYECGEVPVGAAWYNFNPRFYVIGLTFLVFEVELVLTVPVAVVFKGWTAAGRGGIAFVELFLFLAVLVAGLAYLWGKGDLEWLKDLQAAGPGKEEDPR